MVEHTHGSAHVRHLVKNVALVAKHVFDLALYVLLDMCPHLPGEVDHVRVADGRHRA
jgi:hypothetical protein